MTTPYAFAPSLTQQEEYTLPEPMPEIYFFDKNHRYTSSQHAIYRIEIDNSKNAQLFNTAVASEAFYQEILSDTHNRSHLISYLPILLKALTEAEQ
ncbi:MAG: hypothetical protein QM802_25495 [Agriterribacter sp.]